MSDGHVYVASEAGDRILRFNGTTGAPLGAFVAAGSGGLSGPLRLEFGPDGNLYVTSSFSDQVLRYSGSTGAFIDAFVPAGLGGLDEPVALLFIRREITVAIDIKPGSFPNSINLSSAGVVPVAILGSATFDATQVDPATVTLAGARVKLIGKGDRYACSARDVNGNPYPDLVCHVTTAQFLIEPGDSVGVLEGETFGGQQIRGQDSIRIVPN